MNVFDFAMKMELDGKAYYEKLSADTADVGLKGIFTRLAEDEQKHYETIQAIKKGMNPEMADSTVLERTKNLFEVLKGDKSVAATLNKSLNKSLEGYQYARKLEADSVTFYEDMAKQEDSPETVQLLLRIANEEKKHYNILDNLCDFTLAPQYFLEWGEFSNLKGL
ncbi:MAG: ferritin family protein [Desulfuromonadaceae bacterium]|nr:ferritin family protein [Desulfuromonadaceae bacterium]